MKPPLLSAVFFFFLTCSLPAFSLDMTAPLLFDQMEARTEQVDSLQADLILLSGTNASRVNLAIQSPDKFSMGFIDKSVRVVFDGERLWIYLEVMNEVYTLDATSGGGWLGDALRDYVNPKKIITNVTRHTLFSLFEVTLVEQASSPASLSLALPIASAGYCLQFVPRVRNLIQRIFDVGFYEMVFSAETFLPVKVVEFAPDGSMRGMLYVLEYRLNQPLPKEMFVFEIPPGARQMSLIEVLKQRIEAGKDALLEKMNQSLEQLKEKIW